MTPTPENIDEVLDAREKTILRRCKILLAERANHYATRPGHGHPATAQAAVAWVMQDLGLMDSLDQ